MTDENGSGTARELLRDAFARVRDHVHQICAAVSDDHAAYRPDPESNSIAWLIWHLARIQDDHVCGLTGEEQVWTRDAWYDRFNLPFEAASHGYGHTSDDVAKVKVGPELLDGYHAAVHAMTLRYVETATSGELARVIDTSWDPPVTASVRLVSVLGDCLAHLGQADYVRGLAERAGAADGGSE